MSDHDKSLIDHVKDALGMGDHHDTHDHDHHTDAGEEPHRLGDEVGVDGATQAGSEGISGGMGASGAMGGAGAGGPVGATPDPSEEITEPADGNRVRTEYEMGHEFDPEHEKVAESGVMAERRGDAVVDTWREDDDRREP